MEFHQKYQKNLLVMEVFKYDSIVFFFKKYFIDLTFIPEQYNIPVSLKIDALHHFRYEKSSFYSTGYIKFLFSIFLSLP